MDVGTGSHGAMINLSSCPVITLVGSLVLAHNTQAVREKPEF